MAERAKERNAAKREKETSASGSAVTAESTRVQNSAHTAKPATSANAADIAMPVTSPSVAKPTKAKAKTNRLAEDFQERFNRLEDLVLRVVDVLEQPAANHDPEPDEFDKVELEHVEDGQLEDDVLDLHASALSESDDDGLASVAKVPIAISIAANDKNNADSKAAKDEDMGFATKYAIPPSVGKPVDEAMALSVPFLMGPKMKTETLTETGDKYLPPSNCLTLDVPRVHPPIWDNIQATTRSRDLKLQRVEKPLVKGVTALIQSFGGKKTSNMQQDALALLCHSLYELNSLRKEFMKPDINPKYQHLCKATNPVTQYLFGDDLSQKVKDLKEEQKAAEGVMKSSRRKSNKSRDHPYHDRDSRHSRYGNMRRQSRASSYTSRYNNNQVDDDHFLGPRVNRWRRAYQARQDKTKQDKTSKKKD